MASATKKQRPAEQLYCIGVLFISLLAEQSMTRHVLLLFISHQLLLWFQTDAAGPSVFRHPQRVYTEIENSIKLYKLNNHLKHGFSLI